MAAKCEGIMEEETQLKNSAKKRKVVYADQNDENAASVEVPGSSVSPAASGSSSSSSSGCGLKHDDGEECSNVVKSCLESPDLENVDDLQSESFETGISTSVGRVFSRETTPTSGGDSETASKKKPPVLSRRKIHTPAAEHMPSAAELEEFFAAAEKHDQTRFAEKYNYDIVRDVPLEGKYQWVRLQP